MNNRAATCFEWLLTILGITVKDASDIAYFIFMIISISLGVINLWTLVKKSLKDGVIDDKEKKEIKEQMEEIASEVKDLADKTKEK